MNKKFLKLITFIVITFLCRNTFAQQASVLINEIYFDTNPVVALPAVEYVELYNNSLNEVNLFGWTFKDRNSPKTISEDFILPAGGYVLLTKPGNVFELATYGSVVAVTSFPQLNIDDDDLTLTNPQGEIVHEVFYKKSWLNDTDKEEGGWALELIDPDNFCGLGLKENWAASIDARGGTPGALNSVDGSTIDNVAPAINTIEIKSSNAIIVNFTEPIESPGINTISNYTISSEQGNFSIINLFTCNSDHTCVEIEINESFSDNVSYTLVVANLFDCTGNEVDKAPQNFVKPGAVQALDIVINEFLFSPIDGVAEYIEIYNQSNKFVDLNTLSIEDLAGTFNIVTNKNQLAPNSYALLTKDTLSIINAYLPKAGANLVQVENLPTLNNDGDVIRLTNEDFSIIDSVYYDIDWQFRLLKNINGVALERISFTGPSQDATNWQSASKTVNYGTPGYQNSQANQAGEQVFNEIINIQNKTVSPDNDGFEDFLLINYQTEKSGDAANVYIFNEIGQLIAHPIKNELIGVKGTFKWDGLDDLGARIPLGIYIVYAEFFNLDGSINKQKIPIIVAGKL